MTTSTRAFASKRLAALPYHITIENVLLGSNEYLRMVDAMDWLYDQGPPPLDWYVDEREGDRIAVQCSKFMQMKNTISWTFAFRKQSDACLFKLMFA